MTDHESGAKDRAKDGGVAGATSPNVVPFPRSWYGAVEELVPISADPPRTPHTTADATAFWGGDSTPVSALTAAADSVGTEAAREYEDAARLDGSWFGGPAQPDVEHGPGESASVEGTPATRSARARKDRRWSALLALAVCLALFFAADAAFAPVSRRGPASAAHALARRSTSVQIASTKPARTSSSTSAPVHRTVRPRGAKHDAGRKKAAASHTAASPSEPPPSTVPPAQSTQVVSSVAPVRESSSTTAGSPARSSSTGAKSGAGTGIGAAGSLPDIQQTNQQP